MLSSLLYNERRPKYVRLFCTLNNHLNKADSSNADSRNRDAAELTHIDSKTSEPQQVDISEKKINGDKPRIACASGYIQLNELSFKLLVGNKLAKGNALIVAQIAGIQASKQTANLIPLCHQINLDVCKVNFTSNEAKLRVECEAICKTSNNKTGVEMEALTACSVSLLTIYDMIKAVQKDAVIGGIRLEYKFGGKSDFQAGSSN